MLYPLVWYSRFWNCCAVYLVSKMPTPSIRASRTPPIMAEPTIAKGPPGKAYKYDKTYDRSGCYQEKKKSYHDNHTPSNLES